MRTFIDMNKIFKNRVGLISIRNSEEKHSKTYKDSEIHELNPKIQNSDDDRPELITQNTNKSFCIPYLEPIYFYTKFFGLIIIFILGSYVLWQCNEYFKIANKQQQKINDQLNSFNIDAQQLFKQLNNTHKNIQDEQNKLIFERENHYEKIKDFYSFPFQNHDLKINHSKNQCEYTPLNLRFDCHPESGASQLSCSQRGCCWNPLHQLNFEKLVPLDVPYCYYPRDWQLYTYKNYSKSGNDFSGLMKLERNSFYKNDLPVIRIETTGIDSTTLRVKIFNPDHKRYEPKIPDQTNLNHNKEDFNKALYNLNVDDNLPGFKVTRSDDKQTLFNSIGIGGFIFADQFLQISSTLPSHNIYGLGEHRTNLRLNTKWQKLTLFNADQPPTENANLYGSHPFYIVIENSGKAHGVLFLNSNAMDIILQPTPAITYRSIGGIFDIYFFLGPTVKEVLKQYSEVIGKPFMPPYWSLGFHLCRFGYGSLNNTKKVLQRTKDAGIPFDTQWNDLDYMEKNNDFTYDKETFKNLPDFIQEIHSEGMHYIPLIDAGISASDENGTYIPYNEGVKRGVLILDENNVPFKGKVWNLNSTTWPDFTNPNTPSYYADMMNDMHNEFEFDGAWIDMNEPSNFYNGHINGCKNSKLENPPYLPNVVGNLLSRKTLCMGAKHHLGYHYDLHNTYGTSQAIATNYALAKIRHGKRPFIISRSTWVGHGAYAGHWTGDIYSSWHDLRMSIPEILAFSFFQVPMVGADICGFDGNTTVALCNRWMQLGAFYPFSRNHNSDDTIEQDPVAMGQLVVESTKKAFKIRYYLLPYLYTLFYRAHVYGETVARPLFEEFQYDSMTYDIDTHFLWGSCLMIIPVLEEGKTEVEAYIPRGLWYNYYTMESTFSVGKNMTLDAPLDTIPLLLRGGCILPVQEPSVTTTLSRKKPFGLLIALNNTGKAEGELFWDDGDTLSTIKNKSYKLFKFVVSDNTLTSTVIHNGFNDKMTLGQVKVMGITGVVRQVFLNDQEIQFDYNMENQVLRIDTLINFKVNFVMRWSSKRIEVEKYEDEILEVKQPEVINEPMHKALYNKLKETLSSNDASSNTNLNYFKFIFSFIALKYFFNFY